MIRDMVHDARYGSIERPSRPVTPIPAAWMLCMYGTALLACFYNDHLDWIDYSLCSCKEKKMVRNPQPFKRSNRYALLLVKAHQVLDVALATEEDRQPLMDPSRLDVQDPLGTRRGGSTGLFGQVSHGEGLVQDTQLAVLGLGVAWVTKDSSVQQGSVDVGYHRSDVSCAVGALVVLGVFDRFHCE